MLRKILPLFLLLLLILVSASCRVFVPIVYVMNGGIYAASGEFTDAMQEGNGKKAIYWAKRVIYYENKPVYDSWTDKVLRRNPHKSFYSLTSVFNGEYDLVCAYEMNGEFEKALTLFQDLVRRGRAKDASITKARILYKLGRKEEAIETYYRACQRLSVKYERPIGLTTFTDVLLNQVFPFSFLENDDVKLRRRFCNFADIHEFYLFMNEEYEKQNRPEQYAKVMERLREIDQRRDEIMKR
jgi:pentatricopeptide repeat protein